MDAPRVARNANNGNRAAIHPNLSSDILDDDAQKTEERRHDGLFRIRRAVAALRSTGVALVGGVAAGGDSHGECSESEGGEGRESGELHLGCSSNESGDWIRDWCDLLEC